MLYIDLGPDGPVYRNADPQWLQEQGVSASVIGAALKSSARNQVAKVANDYRARVSSTSAGKLAAYKIKEEIARSLETADSDELALIDREATARGQSRDELISVISKKAQAFRKIALLVEVIEAETNASLSAISDSDPDIEAKIANIFEAAKFEADTEFDAAVALIQGI
ncbi:MAG: hypothetical protein ABJZ79_06350 [Parasphingorhabdus sp.]|uniref:hypothetical protein n=1 Tax=Parasphingorhabdus sp. TaxID=2709688 RepID=UPI00329A13CC